MSKSYTGANEYPVGVDILSQTDNRDASSLSATLGPIADRTVALREVLLAYQMVSFSFTGASTDDTIGSSFLLEPTVIQSLDPIYVATGDYCELDVSMTVNGGVYMPGKRAPAELYLHLYSATSVCVARGDDDRWTDVVQNATGEFAIDHQGQHMQLHSMIGPVGIATVYTPQLMCVVPIGDYPVRFHGPWSGITKVIRGGP